VRKPRATPAGTIEAFAPRDFSSGALDGAQWRGKVEEKARVVRARRLLQASPGVCSAR